MNHDYSDFRDYSRTARRAGRRDGGQRFLDYLRSRRAEVWAFFAAGLLIGAILG